MQAKLSKSDFFEAFAVPWSSVDEGEISDVKVTHVWDSVFDYVYGEAPTWQRRVMADGTVFEGPILEGVRHGTWTRTKNGESTSAKYWMGEILHLEGISK